MTPTRAIALALILQAAPSAYFGLTAWGMLTAVLGCGMWALGLVEAARSDLKSASAVSDRVTTLESRMDAVSKGYNDLEQRIASVSSRVSMRSLGG